MGKYKTVAGIGEAEIEEKRSKFISSVFPITCEEEAEKNINAVRKKHYNASHNVFAYYLADGAQKASDDGEPSGTAGVPILDILHKENIKNSLVVVTRYFGGTLLGTGGLVRAYGKAAKEGLLAARIIEKSLCTMYELTVDYHLSGKVEYEIKQEYFELAEIKYTENVTFVLIIEEEKKQYFLESVSKWCQGSQKIVEKLTDYFDLATEK